MSESAILARIIGTLGRLRHVRLFRNNVGVLKDERGQHVRYGVCNPGGSDLIGWTTVVVTPNMVGTEVAIFTAFEVKTERGRPTAQQINFIRAVNEAGGIASVVRSEEEAMAIVKRWL